jgi:hypothetical protein
VAVGERDVRAVPMPDERWVPASRRRVVDRVAIRTDPAFIKKNESVSRSRDSDFRSPLDHQDRPAHPYSPVAAVRPGCIETTVHPVACRVRAHLSTNTGRASVHFFGCAVRKQRSGSDGLLLCSKRSLLSPCKTGGAVVAYPVGLALVRTRRRNRGGRGAARAPIGFAVDNPVVVFIGIHRPAKCECL